MFQCVFLSVILGTHAIFFKTVGVHPFEAGVFLFAALQKFCGPDTVFSGTQVSSLGADTFYI